MASFGILVNKMQKPFLNQKLDQGLTDLAFNKVAGHALTLEEAGDWCPPSCTAECGMLVLNKESKGDEIVSCFKDKCKCKLAS